MTAPAQALSRAALFALPLLAPLAAAPAQSPVVTYETPPILQAPDLWDGNLLQGPHHRVRNEVITSEFTNTYTIDSEFGLFYARSDHMLLERVREIYAIAALRRTKESDAYAKAVGSHAVGTLKGAGNLIKNPVETLSGLGKGASRFLRSVGERIRSTAEGNRAAIDLKQYTEARRMIAGKYKVDPYTSNRVYQAEVESVANASAAGGITFKLASLAIPGGGGIALRGLTLSQDLNEILVQQGPFDLRVQNRRRLHEMAVSDALTETFLDHPHLTPRHHTVITLCLQKLTKANFRANYIRLALSARSEEDAFFVSRSAAILALYNAKRSPVTAIVDCNGIPAAHTAEGSLVLPLVLDYGSWTEVGARFLRSFLAYDHPDFVIGKREIVISGQLSPRARKEFTGRGVIVTEDAFNALAP